MHSRSIFSFHCEDFTETCRTLTARTHISGADVRIQQERRRCMQQSNVRPARLPRAVRLTDGKPTAKGSSFLISETLGKTPHHRFRIKFPADPLSRKTCLRLQVPRLNFRGRLAKCQKVIFVIFLLLWSYDRRRVIVLFRKVCWIVSLRATFFFLFRLGNFRLQSPPLYPIIVLLILGNTACEYVYTDIMAPLVAMERSGRLTSLQNRMQQHSTCKHCP